MNEFEIAIIIAGTVLTICYMFNKLFKYRSDLTSFRRGLQIGDIVSIMIFSLCNEQWVNVIIVDEEEWDEELQEYGYKIKIHPDYQNYIHDDYVLPGWSSEKYIYKPILKQII
ncbi:MAG: hypothetical protein M0R17_07385 [Candidatus Omnitrophica bacterium]|jgi:hypothetical protein|nr:hypothetical protein [Candidatus Omnitrophota bacterium]